jgi:hypothetical protein
MFDDITTINGWMARPGPINLRRVARPEWRRDLRAAEGIINAIVISVAVVAWCYVLVWWLW